MRAQSRISREQGGAVSVQVTQPASAHLLIRWFTWYSRRHLRKHFHALRIAVGGQPAMAPGSSIILYANHASWWDPLVGTVLRDTFFSDRRSFAPIDSMALEKYKFFAKLGFFPVERGTAKGARQFLRGALAATACTDTALWVTPQGEFADARKRPVRFQPGLGHLAMKVQHAVFIPLAIEYVFWEERLPEILVRFGKPALATRFRASTSSPQAWTSFFEHELEATQETLKEQALRRDPADFHNLFHQVTGAGGVYDLWRHVKAWMSLRHAKLEHGTK